MRRAAPGPRSIQSWLGYLVVACTLPAVTVAALLIFRSYVHERASLERDMTSNARALMQAVDGELTADEWALSVLATSPYLATGDLAGFYDQARELAGSLGATNIVLAQANGQQIINTRKPFGTPLLLRGKPPQLSAVFDTGRPVVSDLFVGPVTRTPIIAVIVPVMIKGKVAYGLGMNFEPVRLNAMLQRQNGQSDRIVTVFDRSGAIVARTPSADWFVGRTAAQELVRRMAAAPEGLIETDALADIPVLAAYSVSTQSGWSIAIGKPIAALTSHIRASMLLNVAAAFVLLAVGGLLARYISHRIIGSIRALSAPVLALGLPGPLSVPEVEIAEVNDLGRALAKASELIAQRAIERDKAEAARRVMSIEKHAAEEANCAKSEFLSIMSHELRTPMNAILGFTQLLQNPHFGALTAKQQEFVDAVLRAGNHLLKLIDDILELSRIEAGRLVVSMERVDLASLVKSVVATLEGAAAKAGISLNPGSFGYGLPNILADRVRLTQVLINFGTNAIKYNRPEGTVTLSYELLADGKVRIAVRDTGTGIPEDRQPELFQPFNRLGAERQAIDGTGIGLALSRRLVELMGGQIGFSSILGKGSCFWIDMPVYVASALEQPAEATTSGS